MLALAGLGAGAFFVLRKDDSKGSTAATTPLGGSAVATPSGDGTVAGGSTATSPTGDTAPVAPPAAGQFDLGRALAEVSKNQDQRFAVEVTVNLNGQASKISIDGESDAAAAVTSVRFTAGGVQPPTTPAALVDTPVDLVLNEQERLLYVKAATFPNGDRLAGGAKWLQLDVDQLSAQKGADIGRQLADASRDPLAAAKIIDASKARDGGTIEFNGETLHRFDIDIDTAAALQSNPLLDGQLAQLGITLPPTIAYQVFVTKDSVVRRMISGIAVGPSSTFMIVDNLPVNGDVALQSPSKADSTPLTSLNG